MTTPAVDLPVVELEKLLILSDNYTLYKMCAIINAVDYLARGRFVGEAMMARDSPAEVYYNVTNPSTVGEIVGPILDILNPCEEDESGLKTYKIFMPTEEQRRLLDGLFTSGSCHLYEAWPCTSGPRRLIWEWVVKVSDLNLRTKAGREEKVRRTAHLQEEGKALLNQIKAVFTADFADLVINQEKQQRSEYDRLIPTGKKNARTISSDEYGSILRRMDRGGFYSHEPAMLKVWKTPSDVQHHEVLQEGMKN